MENMGKEKISEQGSSSLDLLMEPSYIVNEKKLITWANQAFFDQFKLSGKAVVNTMSCEEACPTQLCGTKDCPVDRSRRIAKPVNAEVLYKDDQKGLVFFTSKAVPMPDSSSTFVTMNDISVLKETQARLRQLSTDLDVIPTPIMEIDTKFTVTFMNPAGAAIAGLAVDEVIGRKCYELFKTPPLQDRKMCLCTGNENRLGNHRTYHRQTAGWGCCPH